MAVGGDFGFVERSGYEVDRNVDNRMEKSFKGDYLN
jgi:hypothetical protein